MKVAITWTIPPETSKTAIARFLDTGAPPPKKVKMIGRWHSVDGAHGVLIAETDDAQAIYTWVSEWSDLLKFTVTPVLDDSESAGVLKGLRK